MSIYNDAELAKDMKIDEELSKYFSSRTLTQGILYSCHEERIANNSSLGEDEKFLKIDYIPSDPNRYENAISVPVSFAQTILIN